ncbi:hypothetical protein [Enhygromyxa salina]|uniref:Uncharacterized protein n=1 Tax=Enhygromyxa salina TaxID=215803 RepID=A0A2S9YKE4_9BACT|nr:hypothetical protein [Enhygromyxa salina]PRQ05553.1 hypothetical protein ENSA7_44430 [Enhygromyxa salina]
MRTLRKDCTGLELSVAAMFNALELDGVPEEVARIHGLIVGRSHAELQLVERVLVVLLESLEDE